MWTRTLKFAAITAGVEPFPSHAFRRAFATETVGILPRSVTAMAGGWTSTRMMDGHYVQPSLPKLRRRLANLSLSDSYAQPTSDIPERIEVPERASPTAAV